MTFRFQVERRGSDPPIHRLLRVMSLEVEGFLHKVAGTFRMVHPHLDIALQSPKGNWAMLGLWGIEA